METQQIRNCFLEYFKSNGHRIVESSSLIPPQDKTLLFTNAGMVQFKDYFTGKIQPPFDSATSVQRCVRAGGKHNDLDNVGFTSRHHTFFEMLGNFSFGSYFKEEAIALAWELLTREFQIPKERLLVTVFEDDSEAAEIWQKKIKVPSEKIIRCGEEDNFWAMGDTGPCGPCTEIFFDHGPSVKGGPPGSTNENGDRFVEIWNLVFMQYEMDQKGNRNLLPRPAVDTGMGLERIAAVLQNVKSNYEIDIFQKLNFEVQGALGGQVNDNSILKIISDHIRSTGFLIMDGVMPDNEGRGYVLRRIIRRALRYGHKVNNGKPFFYRLVKPLVELMGSSCTKLQDKEEHITRTLRDEEERFSAALSRGLSILDKKLKANTSGLLPADIVFELYDTYGFPTDITHDIASEYGVRIDLKGFEALMQKQKSLAKKTSKFGDSINYLGVSEHSLETAYFTQKFCGYTKIQNETEICSLYLDGARREQLSKGDAGVVCVKETPFYAEAGGQIGDVGIIKSKKGIFEVTDTKVLDEIHLHIGKLVEGTLHEGEIVKATVGEDERKKTTNHHSATHLLHAALRYQLGDGVQQKGSYVGTNRLRFDFSHPRAVSRSELQKIERLVNHKIRENLKVKIEIMETSKAIETGATAFFDEKYGNEVRVLGMGNFSLELCGGTHVSRTGEIGFFKIISESSVGAGVRRIEAVCGDEAESRIYQALETIENMCSLLDTSGNKVVDRLNNLIKEKSQLEDKLKKQKTNSLDKVLDNAYQGAEEINKVKLVATVLTDVQPQELRRLVDNLKGRSNDHGIIVILASVVGKKVRLIAGVNKQLSEKVSAVDLVNHMVGRFGGKGGGRPDLAQAGGEFDINFQNMIELGKEWVLKKL